MRTAGNIIGMVLAAGLVAGIVVLFVAAARYQDPAQRYTACVVAQAEQGHSPACGTSP